MRGPTGVAQPHFFCYIFTFFLIIKPPSYNLKAIFKKQFFIYIFNTTMGLAASHKPYFA